MVVDLPAPFGAEEAGDDAGPDVDGQVVDGGFVAVTLPQPASRDHADSSVRHVAEG
jgi:hypothetical protein